MKKAFTLGRFWCTIKRIFNSTVQRYVMLCIWYRSKELLQKSILRWVIQGNIWWSKSNLIELKFCEDLHYTTVLKFNGWIEISTVGLSFIRVYSTFFRYSSSEVSDFISSGGKVKKGNQTKPKWKTLWQKHSKYVELHYDRRYLESEVKIIVEWWKLRETDSGLMGNGRD